MEDQGGRGRGRGRARGRARGRSRGAEGQGPAAPTTEPQRPGDPAPSGRARGPVSYEQDEPAGPASGRASYRGGAREPRPGMASGEVPRAPVDEMAQLSVGSTEAQDVGKRRSDFRYTEPHTRPAHITDKKGSSGNTVRVMTNFFPVESNPQWMLYQYHVKFNPEVDSKKMRQGMLYDHRDLIGIVKAFDGNILYIPHKLPQEETEVYSIRRSDDVNIRLTITLTNELGPNSLQCLQVYNIIFRKILQEIGMTQIGRHYYNRDQCIDIPRHKLKVMPGFITSILQYESKVMLCADVSHKILRSDTVLDIMYELYGSNQANFHEVCTRRLTGSIVLTRYNNKTYRIDDIEWEKNPSHTFNRRNGEPISYNEYYLTHHKETIKDPNQPLLLSLPKKSDIRAGQTEPFRLIPELCVLTGLTDELRNDMYVMKDLGAHTRVPPDGRRDTLMNFLTTMNRNETVQELLRGWGIRFAQQLLSFNARLLHPEPVYQCQQSLNYRQAEADWSRDMRGKKLQSAINLVDWAIIYVQHHENQASELVKTLQRVGSPMGFMISVPKQVRLSNDRNESYLNALRETVMPTTQLVLCLLPNNRKDRYDAIKKLTCCERPVPSQCVVLRTLGKNLMSVATKIAIQLNCKLGGEVWTVEIPLRGIMVLGIDAYHDSSKKGLSVGGVVASMNGSLTKYYSRCLFQSNMQELMDGLKISIQGLMQQVYYECIQVSGIMVIGIDTYHDSSKKGLSVGGVVCSMNKSLTKYYSKVSFQQTHEELLSGLYTSITAALRQFHQVNGKPPERVVVYRDGVGDGQLPVVVEHEIKQIHTCFQAIGQDYKPKMAVVVVKKRINARIFTAADSRLSNPCPGTIVDSEITKPEWYDFFLVSQSVRQGTVTPTHYNVIWDDSGLKPDHIQRLTYKLTHLYYNWPGTIRVPAPCQYAHKLAFLVGQSTHREPHESLSDKLFFL